MVEAAAGVVQVVGLVALEVSVEVQEVEEVQQVVGENLFFATFIVQCTIIFEIGGLVLLAVNKKI